MAERASTATASSASASASSSSWSNVSSASRRYRDLDTAAMHFWIDKRAAGPHGGPGGHGRYGHRVAASLASARLPPGAAPQRRRRPSRSSRTAKTTATSASGQRPGEAPSSSGAASSSATTTTTTAALTASTLSSGSSSGSSLRCGTGGGLRRGAGTATPSSADAFARAARAHLALPRPRPHLAYIGSTGSGIRAHGGLSGAGGGLGGLGGLGGMLVDLPMEAGLGHGMHGVHGVGLGGLGHGASASGADRADVFALGALPLPVHGDSPPVLMDRFTCGLWASFALASVFVAGTKFYLDFQSSGMEAMVLSLLLMIFLVVGCTASICRARVNSQLAAAAAAATASALRADAASGLRRGHLADSGELVEVVIDRPSMGMDSGPCLPPGHGPGHGQPSQQHQLLQQVQQEQLAEQALSTEPPPPYHIAMLDEQPPPAYEKVVT